MISIRRALRARLLVGLLLLLGVGGAGLYFFVRQVLATQFDDALAAKARALAAVVGERDDERDEEETAEVVASMSEFAPRPDPEYFELWDGEGRVVLRSPSLGARDLSAVSPRELPRRSNLVLPDGRRGRAVVVEIPGDADEGTASAASWLLVARERASLDRTLARVTIAVGALGLFLLLGVLLLVTSVVARGLRPLELLARQAALIDARSLDGRFWSPALPVELRPICTRLDDLLDRLAASFERERRFSADVAHELRTPIAELRALAEVWLKFPESAETSARAFEDVLGAAAQMESLVTALLTLARCEAGRQSVSMESLELERIVRDAWSPFESAARERGLTLVGPTRAPGTVVTSDRTLLSAMLANLFSNAVAYSPRGGQIEWEITARPDGVTLAVCNSNSSLSAADLPHLFEPFWRKDPARSDGAHSGLGLGLVQAFSRLVGATIDIDLPTPAQVRARLNFSIGRFTSAADG